MKNAQTTQIEGSNSTKEHKPVSKQTEDNNVRKTKTTGYQKTISIKIEYPNFTPKPESRTPNKCQKLHGTERDLACA